MITGDDLWGPDKIRGIFRGGKADGREPIFGGEPWPVIHMGPDSFWPGAKYRLTGEVDEQGRVVYVPDVN